MSEDGAGGVIHAGSAAPSSPSAGPSRAEGAVAGPPSGRRSISDREVRILTANLMRENHIQIPVVAAALGVSQTTVRRWTNPDEAERDRAGSRAYKAKVKGTCRNCGRETPYHGRGKRASDLCADCSHDAQRRNRKWTPETIVDAIRRWAAEHGRQPTADDFRRAPEGDYPCLVSIQVRCGSWNAAVEAAGFETVSGGHKLSERAA